LSAGKSGQKKRKNSALKQQSFLGLTVAEEDSATIFSGPPRSRRQSLASGVTRSGRGASVAFFWGVLPGLRPGQGFQFNGSPATESGKPVQAYRQAGSSIPASRFNQAGQPVQARRQTGSTKNNARPQPGQPAKNKRTPSLFCWVSVCLWPQFPRCAEDAPPFCGPYPPVLDEITP